MLESDRQNNGKACILSDTTRILKDLLFQVEYLRKENNTLKNESHYVVLERNELLDETNVIRGEISELQNELRTRLEGNPIWSHGTSTSDLTAPHPATTVFTLQRSPHPQVIATMALPLQHPAVAEQPYAAPRRELQLFPEAAPTEDTEPPQNHGAFNHVMRPQARYPPAVTTLPVHVYPVLPRMEDQRCSSGGTTGSEEEGGVGNR